jgi:hypothetical protein
MSMNDEQGFAVLIEGPIAEVQAFHPVVAATGVAHSEVWLGYQRAKFSFTGTIEEVNEILATVPEGLTARFV